MSKPTNCKSCNKEFGIFRWRYSCSKCSEIFCSDCMTEPEVSFKFLHKPPIAKDKYCPQCWKNYAEPAVNRYIKSAEQFNSVTTYSKNYKGRLPSFSNTTKQYIKTRLFENKDEAERAIKSEALFLGFNVVVNLTIEKETASTSSDSGKGTYHYSVWSANGEAYKSDDK